MNNKNLIGTIVESSDQFSNKDHFMRIIPLNIHGNDPSVHELNISLSVVRDDNNRMPNNIRVFLASWDKENAFSATDITRVFSEYYSTQIKSIFPTLDLMKSTIRDRVAQIVNYYEGSEDNDSDVNEYIESIWNSLPPSDADKDDERWELGNGSREQNYNRSHWFSLHDFIVPVPPLDILATSLATEVKKISSEIYLQITSGDPKMTREKRHTRDESPAFFSPRTCGGFRLQVHILKDNPLNDELDELNNRVDALDSKLNDLVNKVEEYRNELSQKIDELDEQVSDNSESIAKLKSRNVERQSKISLKNDSGSETIRIDGRSGDITLL